MAASNAARLRARILAGMLALTAGAWAVTQVQAKAYERELIPLGQEQLERLKESYDAAQDGMTERDYGMVITAARAYGVYGAPQGKVSVYIRFVDGEGLPYYTSVDYHFVRETGGGWRLTDSGSCHDAQCEIDARNHFGD